MRRAEKYFDGQRGWRCASAHISTQKRKKAVSVAGVPPNHAGHPGGIITRTGSLYCGAPTPEMRGPLVVTRKRAHCNVNKPLALVYNHFDGLRCFVRSAMRYHLSPSHGNLHF